MKYYLRKYKLNESEQAKQDLFAQVKKHVKYKISGMTPPFVIGSLEEIMKKYTDFNFPKDGDGILKRIHFKIPANMNLSLESGREVVQDVVASLLGDYVKNVYNFCLSYNKSLNKLGITYTWKNGSDVTYLILFTKTYNFSKGLIQNIVYFINDFIDAVNKCGGKDELTNVICKKYKEAKALNKQSYICPII